MKSSASRQWLPALLISLLALLVACAPAAPPPERVEGATAAPPKPAATAAPAKPTEAPAAKPADKPAPAPSPAAKPTEKPPAKADTKAVEDFYRGKTVRFIVAFTPGGLYDVWARVIARHMSKHIPGNPNSIVENMTGGAGMVATNHLYNVAPKDGTALATTDPALIMNQVRKVPGVEFDMARFNWAGAISGATITCLARSDTSKGEIKFQELVGGATSKQVILGTLAPGTGTYDYPQMYKALLGANIKLVPGYQGNNEIRLAIEAGELEGYCGTWEAVRVNSRPWVEAGKPRFTIFVQEAEQKDRDPALTQVPLAHDFAKNDADKQLFALLNGPLELTRPFMLPPGVPAERVAALQKAFLDVFKDSALIDEAKKANLEYDPRSGEAVAAKVRQVLSIPADTVQRLDTLLKQ